MDDRSAEPDRPEAVAPVQPRPAGPASAEAGVDWAAIDAAGQLATVRHPLRVGAAIRRTLDVFVREPRAFVVLAIPSAIVGVFATYLTTTASTLAAILLASYVSAIVGLVVGLASIIAADEVRAGRPVELGAVVGRAVGAAAVAFVSGLAQNAVLYGLIFIAAVLFVVGPGAASPAGVAVVLGIAGYVVLRWCMAAPAIALEEVGPIRALARSRSLTKGSLWKIVGVFLGLSLLVAPLAIGAGLIAFVVGGWPGAIVGGLLGLAIGPLYSIASATVLGDLTARPAATSVAAPAPRLRNAFAGLILGAGIVALGVSIPRVSVASERRAFADVPDADRGVILAGTTRANDLCHPISAKTTFTTADTIYLGGYFTRLVPAGQVARVDVFVNGVLANAGEVGSPTQATRCYAERGPLVGAAPGTYRLVVNYANEVIAEGTFTVR